MQRFAPVPSSHARRPRFLSAAVAASLMVGAAAAHADGSVTLYGMVDSAVTYVNNQNGHSNLYLRQGNLWASKFGIRGTEDLGGGTSAIFDLQEGFDVNNGTVSSTGKMFNRQSFVGLTNPRYGTLTIGRQYTPYYQFVGPLTGSFWLTGATGAHAGDIDGLDTTIRVNNALVYTTPSLAGLQASAMVGLGGVAGSTSRGSTLSFALRYDHGPLSAAAGYVRMNNAGTSAFGDSSSGSFGTSVLNQGYTTARAVQQVAAAANYTVGKLVVGVNYSNVSYLPGAASLFADTAVFNTVGVLGVYQFSPTFDIGAGYAYTRATRANGIEDGAQYHQISFKESYHLSRRTVIYALQAYQHASGKTLDALGAIVTASPAVGDSQNLTGATTSGQFVAMLGLAHSF